MAIAVGSYVNFGGSYTIAQVVAGQVVPDPDPLWTCTTYSGAFGATTFQSRESALWEIGFTVFPAGFGAGDICEVQDTGRFWANPAGPGIRIARAMLVFSVVAGVGQPWALPVAWLQPEGGGATIVALWGDLTILRKFGAPVP